MSTDNRWAHIRGAGALAAKEGKIITDNPYPEPDVQKVGFRKWQNSYHARWDRGHQTFLMERNSIARGYVICHSTISSSGMALNYHLPLQKALNEGYFDPEYHDLPEGLVVPASGVLTDWHERHAAWTSSDMKKYEVWVPWREAWKTEE